MRAELVQGFVGAAREVLQQEMGEPVEPGKMKLQGGAYQTQDVTVIVGLAQDVEGAVIISMPKYTALQYVAHIMGEPVDELDELAQSGVGELGNVIAGRAGVALGERGLQVVIAPPTVLIGGGSTLSTVGLQRLVVPLETPLGPVELQVAANNK